MKTLKTLLSAGALFFAASSVAEQPKKWATPIQPGYNHSVAVKTELAYPMVLKSQRSPNYLKVSLIGRDVLREVARSPINLSLVIDRSGSMQGKKIEQAREAALLAVDMLRAQDTLSVIGYDTQAEVIVPATRLTDKADMKRKIRNAIYANGNTALFAGVAKGIKETQKYLNRNHVNRVILLSDGQANVGPSSSSELGELGRAAAKQGIAVSTIGLGQGYNEDLMTTLAGYSDGNHVFVEYAGALAGVFQREFNDVMNVVAQNVRVDIVVKHGKPVRLLGREGDIRGNRVSVRLNQIYANQEKYILLEVAPSSRQRSGEKTLAEVKVSYNDQAKQAPVNVTQRADIVYTNQPALVAKATNEDVLADFFIQQSNEANELAIEALDKGNAAEAAAILSAANDKIRIQARSLTSESAKNKAAVQAENLSSYADSVQAAPAPKIRKALKANSYQTKKQQK